MLKNLNGIIVFRFLLDYYLVVKDVIVLLENLMKIALDLEVDVDKSVELGRFHYKFSLLQ